MMNTRDWCFRCMAELNERGGVCPKCGYDNAKCENELGLLPPCVLAGQYVLGASWGAAASALPISGWM